MHRMTVHPQQRLLLVPCLALYLIGLILPACAGEETTKPLDLATYDAVWAQVQPYLRIAPSPHRVKFGGTGVLWLTGHEDQWTIRHIEAVKRWVARGRVCWIDVGLASRFGIAGVVWGGVQEAVVAEGAAKHPLVSGVQRIRCFDTFAYMRGGPKGCEPIMVTWNRPDHIVVGAWKLGRGLIIFRPEPRLNTVTWTSRAARRWVEPDVADGRRLLYNIYLVTLNTLAAAGYGVPLNPSQEWLSVKAPAPRPARRFIVEPPPPTSAPTSHLARALYEPKLNPAWPE